MKSNTLKISVPCLHINTVPIRLLDDEKGLPALAGAYIFWISLCLDCKVRVLNRKLLPKNIAKYLDQSDLKARAIKKWS